jgi:hypothetical protein
VKMECSFCCAPIAKQVKDGPALAVGGPGVFVCRKCVDICVQVMAESDPDWRDKKIKDLQSLRPRKRRIILAH